MKSNIFINDSLPKADLQYGYDPSVLPFPKSALPKKCQKLAAIGGVAFEILARTGLNFHDQELGRDYRLTEQTDAFCMLISNRDFDVHQTAPQCIATARMISTIALQAERFRATFKYANAKRASFEEMLNVMDKIAFAIGPLADYRVFEMDLEAAAAGIQQFRGEGPDLPHEDGKCEKTELQSRAEKLSAVRGEGPVQTMEFITDAKPLDIARAVKRAGVFDFSVGSVPTNDLKFMQLLFEHLEQQGPNGSISH